MYVEHFSGGGIVVVPAQHLQTLLQRYLDEQLLQAIVKGVLVQSSGEIWCRDVGPTSCLAAVSFYPVDSVSASLKDAACSGSAGE